VDTSSGAPTISSSVPAVGRPTENSELQIDRLYLRLERDTFNFIAGQYDGAFGMTSAFETQQKWLLLRLKLPVIIDLAYIKLDEGTGTTDESSLQTEDATAYGVQVSVAQEAFGGGAFLAYAENKTQNESATIGTGTTVDNDLNDSDLMVFGLWGTFNMGTIEFKGEFDYFDGEENVNGVKGDDLKGQQLWLYAGIKLGDTMKLPINFLYAKGYADKANESQAFQLAVPFGDFTPQAVLPDYAADYYLVPSTEIWDPAGTGGGVMGLLVGFDVQLGEPVSLLTQIGYVEPDNTASGATGVDSLDSFSWIQAGMVWNVLPATEFQAILSYTMPDFKDAAFADDAGWGLYTKIKVKF
jgi:hypothetical protein